MVTYNRLRRQYTSNVVDGHDPTKHNNDDVGEFFFFFYLLQQTIYDRKKAKAESAESRVRKGWICQLLDGLDGLDGWMDDWMNVYHSEKLPPIGWMVPQMDGSQDGCLSTEEAP